MVIPGPGPIVVRVFSVAYLLSALGFAVAITGLALLRHLSVPNQDDWVLIDLMYQSTPVAWIFSLQNGHRLPATFLLYYLDQVWASGRMHLLVIAAQACAWISVGVLAIALRGPGAADAWLRRVLLGFGIFALFWAGSAYNFDWGVNHGSVWTAMWLLVAVAALARARDRTGEPGGARLVLLAAGAALLATFGHGMGVATWGALFAMWIAGRMSWRMGAALAVGALVSTGLYSIGLFGSNGAPQGLGSMFRLFADRAGDLTLFVCAFAGAPIGHVSKALGLVGQQEVLPVSIAAGAFATLGTCALGALAWRRGERLPGFALAGFGLMVFVVGGGLMVGLLRGIPFGIGQSIDLRFLCWSILLWIGGAWAIGGLAVGRGARLSLAASLASLSLLMLPAHFEAREFTQDRSDRARDIALALVLGSPPDELFYDFLSRFSDAVTRAAKLQHEARRSPFDDARTGLAGTPFAERFARLRPDVCSGGSELEWRHRGVQLATVRGRLGRGGIAPGYFVLVDAQGIVRGLGEERPDRAAAAPGRRWEGVVANFSPRELYDAYAVMPDGRSACHVGVIGPDARQPAR